MNKTSLHMRCHVRFPGDLWVTGEHRPSILVTYVLYKLPALDLKHYSVDKWLHNVYPFGFSGSRSCAPCCHTRISLEDPGRRGSGWWLRLRLYSGRGRQLLPPAPTHNVAADGQRNGCSHSLTINKFYKQSYVYSNWPIHNPCVLLASPWGTFWSHHYNWLSRLLQPNNGSMSYVSSRCQILESFVVKSTFHVQCILKTNPFMDTSHIH